MSARKHRKPAPALNPAKLQELALAYVGRYATTRAKLRAYLARKVRERGWADPEPPKLEALADRLAELGYVDDRAFALAKAQTLAARGYGKRRLEEKLRIAGVDETDSDPARRHADGNAFEAAVRFAERRGIGPFAHAPVDPRQRERATAAMIRAGHPFALARAIAALGPGEHDELGELADRFRRMDD
jgi:regulatory protein